MSHEIIWKFDNDHVEATATCTDEECLSRYTCEQECELYYDVRREPGGTVTHAQWDDDYRQIVNRHRMVRADECNVVTHLTVDPSLIPELAESGTSCEIGRTSIEPVWEHDYVLWRIPESGGSERSTT